MIKLDNVSLVFQGGSVALSNVSTEISEGEFVYLIGHSGSGKSSLLKLLYKEYSPTKGDINVVDMDVTSLPKWKIPLLRRKLGIVTQEPQLLEDRTTFENISFALEVLGFEEKEIDEKTSTLIDLVGLNDSMYKFPSQLSGGEQTRACIARALNRAGTTVLMATHVSSIVNRRKKRVLQLKDGKLMSDVDQGRYV
jgi:cell division transport system ATP-binding protein